MPEGSDSSESRGSFLKKAGAVVAGAALVTREIGNIENGIRTPSGVFVPIYETHDVGFTPQRIPDDIQALFRELPLAKGNFEAPAYQLLKNGAFRGGNLEKLAHSGAKVAFGDISLSWEDDLAEMTRSNIAGTAGLMIATLTEIFAKDKPGTPTSGRRKFLTNSVKVTSLWLGLPVATGIASNIADTFSLAPQSNAISRILGRLEGIANHTHPEGIGIFFRNLIMADKMLMIAEQLKQESGKSPKIAFSIGKSHSGIEDILQAGPDVIRTLLGCYSPALVKKLVQETGSVENICTARVLSIPRDFTYQDIDKPERTNLVTEQKIIDIKLANKFQQKIAA